MPLLVRKGVKRHIQNGREVSRLTFTCEKARHIRALDSPRSCRSADGSDFVSRKLREKLCDQLRQALDMGKQRVRLPKPQFAFFYIQKT